MLQIIWKIAAFKFPVAVYSLVYFLLSIIVFHIHHFKFMEFFIKDFVTSDTSSIEYNTALSNRNTVLASTSGIMSIRLQEYSVKKG